MEMIALMISGLALLAAGVCLCLTMQEKKRNQERNAAEEKLNKAVNRCMEAVGTETVHRIQVCDKLVERVANLEKGIIPDYETAAAAVNAVNSFNQGISNILGFDPREALEAQRERERNGE